MNKLLEFGRRTMFYIRVLSGYEERRIRAMRIQMENQIKQATERKAALRRVPEQIVLGEIRRMVEAMQQLNKTLEDAEASIDEYFKPLDVEAQRFVKFKLEGEEKTMEMMKRAMCEQVFLDQAEAMQNSEVKNVETQVSNKKSLSSAPQQQANVR